MGSFDEMIVRSAVDGSNLLESDSTVLCALLVSGYSDLDEFRSLELELANLDLWFGEI